MSRERELVWPIASAAAFGTSGTFVTSLLHTGWSPGAAVISRIGIAALVLTVPALVQLRGRWSQVRRQAGPILGYGIFAIAVAQLCYFNAVQHVSVAVGLLLEYSGILLVVGWQWVRHGHRPGPRVVAGTATALVGLVFVLDLTGSQHGDAAGILWGLGAGVGLAAYFILSARTDDVLPPLASCWAAMVVAVTALLVAVVVGALRYHATTHTVVLGHHRLSWLVPVLGMSLIAAAFAYAAGIVGARLLGARLASFVSLAEVLFAAVFAWVALGERLAPAQLAGAALVVAGIVLVRMDESLPAAAPALDAPVPLPDSRDDEVTTCELVG